MRRGLIIAIIVCALVAPMIHGGTGGADTDDRRWTEAQSGDGYWQIARRLAAGCDQQQIDQLALMLIARNSDRRLFAGSFVDYLEGDIPVCAPATTTTSTEVTTSTSTTGPTSTLASTTAPSSTTPTTVGTLPPSTTSTTLPSSSSTAATTTPTTPPGDGFFEDFTGDTTVTGFRHGSWHRAIETGYLGAFGGTWQADHADHGEGDCGNPTNTSRTITVTADPLDTADDQVVYVCTSVDGDPSKAHLMTSMGDIDGYSVVWFSPDRTFTDQRSVSWDVNVTDLGGRQWWEMAILPVGSPDVVAEPNIARDIASGLEPYPPGAVIVGNGPFGGELSIDADSDVYRPKVCDRSFRPASLDEEGCASKSIRRRWTVTENGDGTLTVTFASTSETPVVFGEWVVDGQFPHGEWKVVWKSHAYTPTKDYAGTVFGLTWHWDNISVS